jgi:hypothetical protein
MYRDQLIQCFLARSSKDAPARRTGAVKGGMLSLPAQRTLDCAEHLAILDICCSKMLILILP